MNVYDTANQLAKEIRQSPEYVQYKTIKGHIEENIELKQKIDDFEKLRYDIQVLAMKGEEVAQEKNKKLQEMYTILIQNKEIKEYFDLEVKFNVMLADVNKIIAESVQDVL
ncbi:MAG: YlbF family regulator [Clostridia bacterium]